MKEGQPEDSQQWGVEQANLGGVGCRVGRVPEQAAPRVAGKVPRRALESVKVIEPVLVKEVPRFPNLPM